MGSFALTGVARIPTDEPPDAIQGLVESARTRDGYSVCRRRLARTVSPKPTVEARMAHITAGSPVNVPRADSSPAAVFGSAATGAAVGAGVAGAAVHAGAAASIRNAPPTGTLVYVANRIAGVVPKLLTIWMAPG